MHAHLLFKRIKENREIDKINLLPTNIVNIESINLL